jgi:DNA-binding NarL/FixJ family response regulator
MLAEHSEAWSRRPLRVLVAETNLNIRAALCLVLERMPRFHVVGQSQDVGELLRDAAALYPDVVIVDLELRGLQVEEHLGTLRRESPSALTIALSTREEQRASALLAGVTAFVRKSESPRKLLQTLNEVAEAAGDRPSGSS